MNLYIANLYAMTAYFFMLMFVGLFFSQYLLNNYLIKKHILKKYTINNTNHLNQHHFKQSIIIIGTIIIIVLVFLYFAFDYVHGVFGTPSVLTTLLCLFYILDFLKSSILRISIKNNVAYPLINKTWIIHQKARNFFYITSALIILSSLGIGTNVFIISYHHYMDKLSIFVHFGFLSFVFMIAFYFDKKTLIIAYLCLLAYLGNIMNNVFILNYIADVWLFLLALCVVVQYIKRFIQYLYTSVAIRPKSLPNRL